MIRYVLLIISFFIVSLGQPSWAPLFCPVAAVVGYTFFWIALRKIERTRDRFLLSLIWFSAIQLVQLSWMTSIQYQGVYILFVWIVLAVGLGIQFSLFSLLVLRHLNASISILLALSSLWALLEWSRLFFLCGFTFNPIGLSLTAFPLSVQLAAVGGVFFLSFLVMFTNLLGVKAWEVKRRKYFLSWGAVALLPYLFGLYWCYGQRATTASTISLALIQTGLREEEKVLMPGLYDDFIHPAQQWSQIMTYLKETERETFDLIVLPEAAVPYGTYHPVIPFSYVNQFIEEKWGEKGFQFLPDLTFPYAFQSEDGVWKVTNAYFAQFLSNYFQSDLVIGLDDHDYEENKNYAAALQFKPNTSFSRYEKQILVPLVEYLPFEWCRRLVAKYGIFEFFEKGKGPKILSGKVPYSVTICYEESFGDLVRKNRKLGAELLVNISNNVWFPASRLPDQFFNSAVLRAVESGVPLIRSCNTGITSVIDRHGNTLHKFGGKSNKDSEFLSGALVADLPIETLFTPYVFWGDLFILFLGIFGIGRLFLTR